MACNATAIWRAHRRGAAASPTRATRRSTRRASRRATSSSRSSRSCRRASATTVASGCRRTRTTPARPTRSPRTTATTSSSASTRPSATSCRATSRRRNAKTMIDAGKGVGPMKNGVYLDFAEAIGRLGKRRHRGALRQPLRDVRAHHRRGPATSCRCASTRRRTTRWAGCGWTTSWAPPCPGLYAIGEANFSDHGANRLGASALMQGLADGYFVLPYTIGNYLAPQLQPKPVPTDHPAFQAVEARGARPLRRLPAIKGTRSVDYFHKELGHIMWDYCGMERTARGPGEGAVGDPRALRGVPEGPARARRAEGVNQSLERAGRVDDFFQLPSSCAPTLQRCGRSSRIAGEWMFSALSPPLKTWRGTSASFVQHRTAAQIGGAARAFRTAAIAPLAASVGPAARPAHIRNGPA